MVGPKTWAAVPVDYPRPAFKALSWPDRAQRFGSFTWTDDDNDGWIKISQGWVDKSITTLDLPLDGVTGWHGHDKCHVLARDSIVGFFADIQKAGLLHLVKSWGGCWAPRRIRTKSGFSPNLSMHAWGIAFDINVAWNSLGNAPAATDKPGSVIELLPSAYARGLYWGGLFKDGMHFEVGSK